MESKIYIHYRWLDPEAESAGDVEFSCPCGQSVKRESIDIYDEIVCECGIRYKFHTEIYVKKVTENAE